jgi:hypothetical protein
LSTNNRQQNDGSGLDPKAKPRLRELETDLIGRRRREALHVGLTLVARRRREPGHAEDDVDDAEVPERGEVRVLGSWTR